MMSVSSGVRVGADCVQFSVHGGGCGGKGTSPASVTADRLSASREAANSLFIMDSVAVNV